MLAHKIRTKNGGMDGWMDGWMDVVGKENVQRSGEVELRD